MPSVPVKRGGQVKSGESLSPGRLPWGHSTQRARAGERSTFAANRGHSRRQESKLWRPPYAKAYGIATLVQMNLANTPCACCFAGKHTAKDNDIVRAGACRQWRRGLANYCRWGHNVHFTQVSPRFICLVERIHSLSTRHRLHTPKTNL